MVMKTREQILDTLRRAAPELAREYGVTRLALFGSHARGEATEESDVDVLVEVDPSIGLRFVDLADRIEDLVGLPVDVISTRALSPSHWADVEKDLVDVG
jgi:predicted nucleotidyltransferase